MVFNVLVWRHTKRLIKSYRELAWYIYGNKYSFYSYIV
jgi:hypothetical protein